MSNHMNAQRMWAEMSLVLSNKAEHNQLGIFASNAAVLFRSTAASRTVVHTTSSPRHGNAFERQSKRSYCDVSAVFQYHNGQFAHNKRRMFTCVHASALFASGPGSTRMKLLVTLCVSRADTDVTAVSLRTRELAERRL